MNWPPTPPRRSQWADSEPPATQADAAAGPEVADAEPTDHCKGASNSDSANPLFVIPQTPVDVTVEGRASTVEETHRVYTPPRHVPNPEGGRPLRKIEPAKLDDPSQSQLMSADNNLFQQLAKASLSLEKLIVAGPSAVATADDAAGSDDERMPPLATDDAAPGAASSSGDVEAAFWNDLQTQGFNFAARGSAASGRFQRWLDKDPKNRERYEAMKAKEWTTEQDVELERIEAPARSLR